MNFDRPIPEKSFSVSSLDSPVADDAIYFGEYELIPKHHLLLKNGEPIPLGSRAMLLLIAMATRAGDLLEKSELLALVWPKVVVEECNLRISDQDFFFEALRPQGRIIGRLEARVTGPMAARNARRSARV